MYVERKFWDWFLRITAVAIAVIIFSMFIALFFIASPRDTKRESFVRDCIRTKNVKDCAEASLILYPKEK